MQAGKLDQRITLQNKVVTRNAIGDEVATWEDLDEIWASYRPVRVDERLAGAQLQAEFDAVFRIRKRSGITAETRVIWRDQSYELVGEPMTLNARSGEIDLFVTRGVRDGR